VELLKKNGLQDRFLLLIGGAIASKDFEELKSLGAANVYGPGSLIKDIVTFIQENVKK
jgi:methylmalonyl-CoA mutase cobalamin-binding domain/chain